MIISVINLFIKSFLFILPIVLSGILFIVFLKNKILFLRNPIDFGLKINNKRIFGQNKTWQGPIVMSFGTLFFAQLLSFFIYQPLNTNLEWQNFSLSGVISLLLLGLSYSLGELPNSFIKRQLNIAPGKKTNTKSIKYIFNFIDKVDSIIAVTLAAYFLYGLELLMLNTMLILGLTIHWLTDFYMERIKLK